MIWFRKELRGDRLGFQLLRGSGPSEGYVSIKIKGKEQNGSFDRLLFESSRWIITALFRWTQSKSGWIGQSSNRNDPNGLCVGWNAWNMVVRTQWRHSKTYSLIFWCILWYFMAKVYQKYDDSLRHDFIHHHYCGKIPVPISEGAPGKMSARITGNPYSARLLGGWY